MHEKSSSPIAPPPACRASVSSRAVPSRRLGISWRRVTHELIDVTAPVERAFLVAVDTGDDPGWTAEESISELASLADTAGAEVVGAGGRSGRLVGAHFS